MKFLWKQTTTEEWHNFQERGKGREKKKIRKPIRSVG